MLGEVVAADQRALIFTQYREMGDLLARHLSQALRLPKVPFLHGGVPAKTRDAMVEAFQTDDHAPPLLIVSLKAGGTGLNLTRATHVLHYDRWWNPAVEDRPGHRPGLPHRPDPYRQRPQARHGRYPWKIALPPCWRRSGRWPTRSWVPARPG
jgi:helicase-like protein